MTNIQTKITLNDRVLSPYDYLGTVMEVFCKDVRVEPMQFRVKLDGIAREVILSEEQLTLICHRPRNPC